MNGARCFFFGCWNVSGHGLFWPGGADVNEDGPFVYYGDSIHLDGTLSPVHQPDGRVTWGGMFSNKNERQSHYYDNRGRRVQGEVLIHHLSNGFTAMSWWDSNQGDRRSGCNSTVLLEGKHDAAAMMSALREHFPHVLANLERAGVTLIDVTPTGDAK